MCYLTDEEALELPSPFFPRLIALPVAIMLEKSFSQDYRKPAE